MNDMSHKH